MSTTHDTHISGPGPRSAAAFSAAVLCVVLTSGCGTVRLAPADRLALRSVAVETTVQEGVVRCGGPLMEGYNPAPETFYHIPLIRELTLLYSFSPVGLWQAYRGYRRMEVDFEARLREESVRPAEIVRRTFVGELESAAVFPAVVSPGGAGDLDDAPDADARFHLSFTCGLSPADIGFEPGVRPWVRVEGELRHRDGRVLWKSHASSSALEHAVPAYEIEKFFLDPELFEHGLDRASWIAARDLVDHMLGH